MATTRLDRSIMRLVTLTVNANHLEFWDKQDRELWDMQNRNVMITLERIDDGCWTITNLVLDYSDAQD